jgi:hypothetical protein
MKLVLLFIGFTVGIFIVGLVAYFAMNALRMILMTVFAGRRHAEAEKRLSDPGTQWFPPWLPPLMQVIWFASGLVTISIRYAFRVWWPVLLLAAVLTGVYSSARPEQASGTHPVSRSAVHADSGNPRSFTCKEPLPEFTLGPTSSPSDAELAKLCACILGRFPEGGWEREVSGKIRRAKTPAGFSARLSRDLARRSMLATGAAFS